MARIVSGSVRLRLHLGVFTLVSPTRPQRYEAQELFAERLDEASAEGLFSEEELYDHLVESGAWDEESDGLLSSLPKEIEEFKFKLYKANFRSNERAVVRKALRAAEARVAELEGRRHAQDHLSRLGFAALARSRYLLGACLLARDGSPACAGDPGSWPSELLEEAAAAHAALRLGERDYRELARGEPWRSLWGCRRGDGDLFGVPAADYTDEQRAIVSFACLYDDVRQHPECPADDVVADDDLLDGWLIDQRRRRADAGTDPDGLVTNERIRNSQEVFFVADTREDADRIMAMNNEHARAVARGRFRVIAERGSLSEADMPDTKRNLANARARGGQR